MNKDVSKDVKKNLKQSHKWLRGLWMLLFGAVAYCAIILAFVIVLFQFIAKLCVNEVNVRLFSFSQSLSTYVYQMLQYIIYEADQKPYPFAEWPNAKVTLSTKKQKSPITEKN